MAVKLFGFTLGKKDIVQEKIKELSRYFNLKETERIFLVLALTIYSGSMISSAIAATNGATVVLNDDDKKKKKKKKKACCSSTEAKACPAKTETKSCCSSKKN